jgi:hypothetical protein
MNREENQKLEKWLASDEYKEWRKSGHLATVGEPLDTKCNHKLWSWKKHGRVCPCGVFIVDPGD